MKHNSDLTLCLAPRRPSQILTSRARRSMACSKRSTLFRVIKLHSAHFMTIPRPGGAVMKNHSILWITRLVIPSNLVFAAILACAGSASAQVNSTLSSPGAAPVMPELTSPSTSPDLTLQLEQTGQRPLPLPTGRAFDAQGCHSDRASVSSVGSAGGGPVRCRRRTGG